MANRSKSCLPKRVKAEWPFHSQRKRRNLHDGERTRRFLWCNMEETQLSIATASENIFLASWGKGRRGGGSIHERAAARICSALSAFNHYRFVLSIGQHRSSLVQKTHLPRATTPCTSDGADISTLQWQYQLIYFSLSPILSYYITTRKDNMVKEKGLRVVRSWSIYYYGLTTFFLMCLLVASVVFVSDASQR